MVSDNNGESVMSVSTAMTGEVVSNGGKQPSIKKVKPKVSINDYDIGKVVGQGAFGRVMLAKEIATGA